MNKNGTSEKLVSQDTLAGESKPLTLSMHNMAKRYGKRWVVKDVSFAVSQGEVVGLLGPNGAGKTTSFYMVVGLVNLDKGTVVLGNKDLSVYAMHERARAGIGYLPQEASVFRKLSVEDNILAILQTRKDLNRQQQKQALDKLIDEFNLSHVRHSLGMSVSGGERRRCEIARALAADPKFILLDEPFAGVDPISVGDIKAVITALKNRGIGVLITDHNVRETLAICEKAYIVSEGAIIAEGTPQDILDNELVKEVYLGKDFQV
ncbi:LPS export ABC transporter ATP-binding protein [Psychrobacter sp. I-STPA10]|uniref:LPS export ABC transporter ATP-binding protein n=1 Tax=Psychrobacter sp. I-STPA10 TaxID=2585769 RepID=UPI001E2FF6CA|nr:LPS export ABC transporter ATP-binding protein [Psychrobacter sp. I-STPA10]